MLDETDLKDNQGNIVIQPGLKVRHKKSQYEYTVEDVIQDPDGEVSVILRLPEEPRFTPPSKEDVVLADNKSKSNDVMLYEADPDSLYFEPEAEPSQKLPDDEYLAVPQKEFEKEYEVR